MSSPPDRLQRDQDRGPERDVPRRESEAPPATDPPRSPRDLAFTLRHEQRERWSAGDRVPAEEYFSRYSELRADASAALDLIFAEYLLRVARGEAASRDEYLRRFPEYVEALGVQFDLDDALRGGGSSADRGSPSGESVPSTEWTASAPVRPEHRLLADTGDRHLLLGLLTHGGSGPTDPEFDRAATHAAGTSSGDGRRFRVLRPHACGGLGAVYVALDAELNREVALKQILDRHADDPVSRQRFLVEAEITGGLEHPGIVPVYGLGTYDDGRPYYAMRFVRGDSLKEAIERFHADQSLTGDPGRRSLELRKLLRRFLDVCNAVGYAHARGVLHRDIKPSNVIVGKHGETLVVDWGLAKPMGRVEPGQGPDERTLVPTSASGSAETLPGQALGTPPYMSPEQAAGNLEALGPRSDVYSLGATLYCLLTNKPPFDGDVFEVLRRVQRGEFARPRALDPSIDPALESVCLKAMARDPDDRYTTTRAMADDVERWAADEPVTAYRDPLVRRARRWARRNRTPVTAAAAALMAGVVGLAALAAEQARSFAALKKANGETKAALAQSEESRRQAEAVGNFLVDALKKPDPSVDGKDVKVADVLDQASVGLQEGFAGSKATEGALLDALGRRISGWAYTRRPRRCTARRKRCGRRPWGRRTGTPSTAPRGTPLRCGRPVGMPRPWPCSRRHCAGSATRWGSTTRSRSRPGPASACTTRGAGGRARGSRCSGRSSLHSRRGSGPTTPTRSPAAASSPRPTGPPAGTPRRPHCSRRT